MATLEELQARITRLDDIKQVEKLQRIYGYYLDYFEYQKVVDLFSDNCESVEVADFGVYRGKAGVKRFYLDLLGSKPPRVGELSIGMIMQGVVDIDPDGKTAKGRWYCMSIEAKPTISLHEGELRQLWGNGIYENEYVKENGKWLFKKVFYFLNFRTPYEDGWLKVPWLGSMEQAVRCRPMHRQPTMPLIHQEFTFNRTISTQSPGSNWIFQKELPSARKCLEEEMRQMSRLVNWTMIQKKGGEKKGKRMRQMNRLVN